VVQGRGASLTQLTTPSGHSARAAAAFLGSNILLYAVLAWLGRCAPTPFDRTLLLALGNLCLAGWLLVKAFRRERFLHDRGSSLALLGWSAAYSVTYGAFVRWPELIPVWVVVAAQAGAPLIAVFLSGDHRRYPEAVTRRLFQSSPLVFLVFIVWLEWRAPKHTSSTPQIALAMIVLFVFSQSCARVVARNVPTPFWAPPRLALLNGVVLLGLWSVLGHAVPRIPVIQLTSRVLLLSASILAIQALYLFALSTMAPFLSALFMSTSVPISMLGDAITNAGPAHHPLSLWCALGFSAATGLVSWASANQPARKRHPCEASPS